MEVNRIRELMKKKSKDLDLDLEEKIKTIKKDLMDHIESRAEKGFGDFSFQTITFKKDILLKALEVFRLEGFLVISVTDDPLLSFRKSEIIRIIWDEKLIEELKYDR